MRRELQYGAVLEEFEREERGVYEHLAWLVSIRAEY